MKNGYRTYTKLDEHGHEDGEEYEVIEEYYKNYGELTFSDGAVGEGELDENNRLVFGKVTWPDGFTLIGSFKEGYLTSGEVIFPNGEIHEGEFYKNGNLKEGKISRYDGTIEDGEFDKNGQLIEGKITHPDGRVELVDKTPPLPF